LVRAAQQRGSVEPVRRKVADPDTAAEVVHASPDRKRFLDRFDDSLRKIGRRLAVLGILAEAVLMFWLLIRGVDTKQWQKQFTAGR